MRFYYQRWVQKENEPPSKIELKSGFKQPGKGTFIVNFQGINTRNDAEQLKKNKELEDSKSWSHLSHKQKEEKGYEYVCHYHHNDEFLDPLEEKIRQLALGEEVF